MLVFNPLKRFDAKDCLMHHYFDGIRDQDFSSIPNKPFDWAFDEIELDKEVIQKLIYQEALRFHPDNEKTIEKIDKIEQEIINLNDNQNKIIDQSNDTEGELNNGNLCNKLINTIKK